MNKRDKRCETAVDRRQDPPLLTCKNSLAWCVCVVMVCADTLSPSVRSLHGKWYVSRLPARLRRSRDWQLNGPITKPPLRFVANAAARGRSFPKLTLTRCERCNVSPSIIRHFFYCLLRKALLLRSYKNKQLRFVRAGALTDEMENIPLTKFIRLHVANMWNILS